MFELFDKARKPNRQQPKTKPIPSNFEPYFAPKLTRGRPPQLIEDRINYVPPDNYQHVLQLPGEEWRMVEGFENYQVSNMGRMKSLRPWSGGKVYETTVVLRVSYQHSHGTIGLRVGYTRRVQLNIARLVALAILGPPPDGCMGIKFRDGNKYNAAVRKLEYGVPPRPYAPGWLRSIWTVPAVLYRPWRVRGPTTSNMASHPVRMHGVGFSRFGVNYSFRINRGSEIQSGRTRFLISSLSIIHL